MSFLQGLSTRMWEKEYLLVTNRNNDGKYFWLFDRQTGKVKKINRRGARGRRIYRINEIILDESNDERNIRKSHREIKS